MDKREIARLVAFVLLAIGTIGLLVNEATCDGSRSATLSFAVLNAVGLATLAFTYWGMKKE